MIYKILEIKEYPHLFFGEIIDAKQSQGFGLGDYVSLNVTELKSILSAIYVDCLHKPEIENNQEISDKFLYEKNLYLKISRDFGRILLENLDGYKREWFQDLLKSKYKLDGILHNQELIHFVNEALISQMPIRQWEYGRFFLQRLFPILVDKDKWRYKKDDIYISIKDDENPLLKIATMFKKSTTTLNAYENFILIFVLKQELLKERITMQDYTVISQIAQQRMLRIYTKRFMLNQSLDSVIRLKWNLNKGRGGPRR